MTNSLAEIPYWLPIAVAVLAVVVWVMGNNRLDKTLKRLSLAILAAALATFAVSYFLESDREQVARHTRALVRSVETKQWDAFRSLLHPDVKVLLWTGPDAVTNAATAATTRFDPGSARVTALSVEETRPTLTARLQVVASNSITNWDLEWEKHQGQWLLLHVTPLGGPGLTSAGIEMLMRRGAP